MRSAEEQAAERAVIAAAERWADTRPMTEGTVGRGHERPHPSKERQQ